MSKKYDELVGKKFGRLLLTEHVWISKEYGRVSAYVCQCECGNIKTIRTGAIKRGASTSCGCYAIEKDRTHGMTRTTEFWIWQGLRQRCLNPKAPGFKRYGAKGIKVSERWDRFENFLSDMGRRPSKRHSIDRRDRRGDYSPRNCRWATVEEQQLNRDITVLVNFYGRDMTVNELSDVTGINKNTLRSRIRDGLSIDKITSPAKDQSFLITIGEDTKSLAEWSRSSGVQSGTIARRFKLGWTGMDLIKPPRS